MRWSETLFRIVLALSLALPVPVLAGKIEPLKLQEKLHDLLPRNARWALAVTDLESGREVIGIGSAKEEQLVPGSLVKLITSGAVLDRGRMDLCTEILHDGAIGEGVLNGNLYLRGRGNAFLSADDLGNAAEKLAQLGIRKVTGDIVFDASRLDPAGLARSRTGAGYAPPGALGTDLHTVAVIVTPTTIGKPPQVRVEPPNDSVRLALEARTTATVTDSVVVSRLDDAAYRVSGNIRVDAGTSTWRLPLLDPARYGAESFRTLLRIHRVETKGEVRNGAVPGYSHLLVRIDGPALGELLRDMNQHSLNVVADNLFLLLGAERYGVPGTQEKGARAADDFLDTLGLSRREIVIVDGSGLLERNRVTARFMAEYLWKVSRKDWFGVFLESLPRPGLDGTLRDIGYANERFRVKSGRLENAFALAGYGTDANGRGIAFTYIVNLPGASAVNLERSGAAVLRYLGTEVLQ